MVNNGNGMHIEFVGTFQQFRNVLDKNIKVTVNAAFGTKGGNIAITGFVDELETAYPNLVKDLDERKVENMIKKTDELEIVLQPVGSKTSTATATKPTFKQAPTFTPKTFTPAGE